jgi:glyoxylase-like metal-dependent hydrolase (beta-lactamase superfamily II)
VSLRRFTTFHEEWKQLVGWVVYEAPDGTTCVIDPMAPEGSFASPPQVLISVHWHTRHAGEWARRFGATVWAPSGIRAAVAKRAGVEPKTFRPGDELPGGIQAFATSRRSEVVFWLPAERMLVPGDAILGAEGGGLRLCPASWVGGEEQLAALRESLRPLLDLPVERVLVSHGEPVTENALAALRRALQP